MTVYSMQRACMQCNGSRGINAAVAYICLGYLLRQYTLCMLLICDVLIMEYRLVVTWSSIGGRLPRPHTIKLHAADGKKQYYY